MFGFAVVQAELYRRYLRLAVERMDVRPMAHYLKHLTKVRVYITDTGSLQPLTVAEMRPLTAAVRC